jgi:hypothetical protein
MINPSNMKMYISQNGPGTYFPTEKDGFFCAPERCQDGTKTVVPNFGGYVDHYHKDSAAYAAAGQRRVRCENHPVG